jgi:hypothetical protein
VPYQGDLEQGRGRFFSLMIERDPFGTIRLARNWGLVGSRAKSKSRSSPMGSKLRRRWKAGPHPNDGKAIQTHREWATALVQTACSSWMIQRLAWRFDDCLMMTF